MVVEKGLPPIFKASCCMIMSHGRCTISMQGSRSCYDSVMMWWL